MKSYITHEIDGKYMREWLILGPFFPDDLNKDFLADAGGEANVFSKEGGTVTTTDGRTLAWKRYESEEDVVNLLDAVGNYENATAYAFCVLESEVAGDAVINLGSDNGVAVWLNGKRVQQFPDSRLLSLDQDIFEANLKAGANYCLVKIYNLSGGWAFAMRVVPLPPDRAVLYGIVMNEAGKPIPDALVHLEKDGKEIAQTTTDDSGSYRLTVYPVGGSYDLSATSGNLGDWQLGIELDAGERQKLNLTLREAISIEGTLLMLDHKTPHGAVAVQAVIPASDGKGEPVVAEAALSDESGRYQLINLRPGQYKLRCYIPGGHVYYEGEKAGKPESRREPESQGARKPIILQVERGKTLKNIDFRFHQFKKGTWRHYGISDGLASMSVNDICLASDGTLWFSTGSRDWIIGSGVSRYDGQKFVNFTTKDGLVHNAVKSIYCDQDGVMWFGTYGGVSRYDGEKFVNFTTADGLPNHWVFAIHGTPDGVLWFGTRGGGVSRYEKPLRPSATLRDGEEFVNFTTADGLPNNWVYSIHSTPDGTLWFGQWEVLTNRGGISRYEKPLRPSATLRDGEEFVNFTTEDGLAHNCVYAIHSTPDGVLWFGTEGGVSRYDARGMGDSPHFVNFTMKDGLVHNSVWAIHGDSDGIMWFGTEGGVSRYDGNGFVNFTREYGLMDNGVEAIYGSADGSLWFGSQHGGVSRYDERTFTILTEDDGLAHNMVRAIHSASDGVLWLGTKGGVSRYDGKDFVNFTRENGLAADDVGVIHRDADGALWFGTGDLGTSWGGGVSRYDPAAEKVGSERFVNFTIRDGLAANGVFAIHSAPDGTLWFGTRDGVSRYDGKELVNVNREIGLGLDGYRMTASCIHIVSDDILWLGGYDVLRRYDGKELVNFTTQDGLADDFILAIHDDHDGALWIATYGGISRCDGRSMGDSPHFLNFTAEDGLAGNQMGTIYAEPDGTLWFGGDGGISGYDGVAWTSLDGRDGLAGNRVYSIEQDPDGNFWIGTDKGLIHYRRSKTKPKVRIVSVTTDETYVDLSAIPPLVVGSRVTIEYNSIDFKTIPEKRQYRVRIIKIPPAPLW